MGYIVSIPKRVIKVWLMKEGVSLLEQQRKFQSLKGIKSELRLCTYWPLQQEYQN